MTTTSSPHRPKSLRSVPSVSVIKRRLESIEIERRGLLALLSVAAEVEAAEADTESSLPPFAPEQTSGVTT